MWWIAAAIILFNVVLTQTPIAFMARMALATGSIITGVILLLYQQQ